MLITKDGEPIEVAAANAPRRKMLATIDGADNAPAANSHGQQQPHHSRNRSISEYVPNPMGVPKRPVTVSGSHLKIDIAESQDTCMRRELNFRRVTGLDPNCYSAPDSASK